MPTIALYGGSFNPPTFRHRHIVARLHYHFDRVIVIPCGMRNDKLATNSVAAHHRAHMCRLTFDGIEKVEIDTYDIDNNCFTPTCDLQKRYEDMGEVWHIVGTDLIHGGHLGESEIQRSWKLGPKIWTDLQFGIILRGEPIDTRDLPPNSRIMYEMGKGSSTDVRNKILAGESIAKEVPRYVCEYILQHRLYLPPKGESGD